MYFKLTNNAHPPMQYLEMNGKIVGWITRVIDGKWSYMLTSDKRIDAPHFKNKRDAEIELLKAVSDD